MKSYRNIYSLTFATVIFLIGCSSSEKMNSDIQIRMTKHQVDAWLNMMPGTSPGTFHLAGEITFENNGTVELDSLTLTKVIVFADSEEVYAFKPVFKTKITGEDLSLSPGLNKEFTFGTEKGLKINEKLINNKMIDLKLELETKQGMQNFRINNVKVERAY